MTENKSVIGLSWDPKLPPLVCGTKGSSEKHSNVPESSVWKRQNDLVDGLFVPPRDPRKLNKLLKKNVKDTIGASWFHMPAPVLTPEMKRDLQIIKLRSAIDPKRHYKKADSKSKAFPKYFQMGTVVESASDLFSSRLTKKERKSTITDELLSDPSFEAYRKRKLREIHDEHRPAGVQKWKIRGRETLKRAKDRRKAKF